MSTDLLRKWWNIFVDGFTEVRILSSYANYSGYFSDFDNLVNNLMQMERVDSAQVYFILNKMDDACYSRVQCEHFVKKPKQTTSDNDITARRWILIDLDPKRPAGVNATNGQLEQAHRKALDVFRDLSDHGFSEPVVAMSGNGYHLLYRVDMAADGKSTALVQSFLRCLADRYGDNSVDIDEKVFNAARICKLYGTTAHKGANTPDRPCRQSKIVRVPQTVSVTPEQTIRDYVSKNEVKMEQVRTPQGSRFSLDGFISEHGIRVYKEIRTAGGVKYQLEECPFDSNHRNGDAALFESADGRVGFHCFHNSCSGRTWHDVRRIYDPQGVERAEQWQNRQQWQRMPQRPEPPQPKQENEHDGRKWLKFSTIENVDIENMPKVTTGFRDLDSRIRGIFYGELVVLSGSNSAGKSSLINTLLLNLVDDGVKCALWSGELPAHQLKAWIKQAAAGQFVVKSRKYDDSYYVPDNVGSRIEAWIGDRLLIYNNNYGAKWEQVFGDMSLLIPYGYRFFVLDNLMSLDIDVLSDNKNEAQKQVMLNLREFCQTNKVIILLVAHPRKVTSFLRKEDISGTGDITNIPDDVFIMHRINIDFYKRGCDYYPKAVIEDYVTKDGQKAGKASNVIEVTKNRMLGNQDFLVGLQYDTYSRRFLGDEDALPKDYGFDTTGLTRLDYGVRNDEPERVQTNIDQYTKEAREIAHEPERPFAPADPDADLPF